MNSRMYGECIWIAKTLKNCKRGLSLEELNNIWLNDENLSGGIEIGQRKFQRHKKVLLNSFGIKIECDKEDGYRYYISNPEAMEDDEVVNWIINSLSVTERLSRCISLYDRILLPPVPTTDERFDIITEAMRINHMVMFNYLAYGASVVKPVELAPYCLKFYRQRWYLLGRYGTCRFCTFCLDRMSNASVTDRFFEMDPNFKAAEYFEDIVGIVRKNGEKVISVVVRAFKDEPYYLRDVPIHSSQKEIGSGDGYTDFMFNLIPNLEFYGYLLQRGSRVKLLSPASMVEEITRFINEMGENYGI